MLAEMGDKTFRLGNVHANTYDEIFGGHQLRSLVENSIIESLPGCADCAFQPFCGCDPLENYATQGSVMGHRPTSAFTFAT
jgi:radical SAM protein with 4Fe4S-binding SPASM domain